MNWGIIFFLWFGVIGAVCLFSGYSMKTKRQIKIGWFIGRDVQAEKCRDIPGFIDAVYPKIMTLGTIATVGAVLMILLEVFEVTELVQLVLMIVILIYYGWFNHHVKKATKQYLD
ncbi:MAG: hypothetical protein ACLU61_05005 [Lachnospiraceae bacterium]